MARCTLDDLVPSTRCNRIFLEPIGTSHSEYAVSIDMSVYDVIDDEDGIADYFFTNEFRENIIIVACYSTSEHVDNLYKLLKSSSRSSPKFKPSLQSMIFTTLLQHISVGSSIETAITNLLMQDSVFSVSSPLRNSIFRNNLIEMANLIPTDSFELVTIDFEGYSSTMIEAFGSRKFDEDGNITYDLKIDKSDLTFQAETTAENIYLHTVAIFDIVKLFESRGVDINSAQQGGFYNEETVDFYFKDIDRCVILKNKIPGSKVQDFRLSERIPELIRPAFITDYDNTIDLISTITGNSTIRKSDITSELFTSYKKNTPTTYYTKNIFFINISNLLRKNAKYPFLHTNLEALNTQFVGYANLETPTLYTTIGAELPNIDNFISDSLIGSIDIYRVRIDDPDDRVLVTQSPTVEPTDSSEIYRYTFSDFGFASLSHGKYKYELELTAKDPMEDLIEFLVLRTRPLQLLLASSISYIHNNAEGYNELRDELALETQTTIRGIFNSDPLLTENLKYFQSLFFLFVKKSFKSISSSSLEGVFSLRTERRKIESLHRIIEDLLFEIGKYYETKDINSASLTSIKGSSIFNYHRRWDSITGANVHQSDMIDIIESTHTGNNVTANAYNIRTTIETQKFLSPSGESSINIGYLTPNKIGNINIFDIEANEANVLAGLFLNMLQQPDWTPRQRTIMESMVSNDNSYNLSVSELRNNSGVFESFLADQGATVINKSAPSINTDISMPIGYSTLKGIDVGRNDSDETASPAFTQLREAQIEESLDRRRRAKQQLLNEHTKKEDIISRILVTDEAYSLLDRNTFTQGVRQDKRFNISSYAFDRHLEEQRRSLPLHLYRPANTLTDSISGTVYKRAFNRLIIDNIFMVYYLDSFDANMNPKWLHLTDFSTLSTGKVLCKLKRFKSSTMHMGQGTLSDREILSKYFYLIV